MKARVEILEPSLITSIVDEAMSVLETTGAIIGEKSAYDYLCSAGLHAGEDGQVTFPRKVIEDAIQSAPSSISLFDRDGAHHATLEGDRVHFVPASSALTICDDVTNEIRDATTDDFIRYVKVADGLENLAYLSTAFVPKDVPEDIADAWRVWLCLAHSKQPIVSGAFTADGVERILRVLDLFRSDRAELAQKPLAILSVCPNTPLRWGKDPVQNLMDSARNGIPVEIVPVLLLGMISPATTVGALVLHTAEVLSGLTIAQLTKPGAPIIFGGAPAAFHMRLMTNPMTAVEALQIFCGYAQIADHLGLPSQGYMALSDSKRHDAQSGAETSVGAFLAAMAGINSVSGPGMLDYVNCFSLEKLVFDDEIVAHAKRFVQPVQPKNDLPTRDLIEELLREKHLLMAEHTLEHWPDELYLPGPMVDRTNWDQWKQQGSKEARERAQDIIEEKLNEREAPTVSSDMHREMSEFFTRDTKHENVTLPSLGH